MDMWIYDNSININEYVGFVYIITNTITGKAYIGKKQVWTFKKNIRDKESDWKKYWSSSYDLKADVQALGQDKFTRKILHWCKTKSELSMMEVEEQFKREVLKARLPNGERAFYNKNIMNRFFTPPDSHSLETREKRRIAMSGRIITEEHAAKIASSNKNKPKSETHKKNLSAARKREIARDGSRQHTEESRAKISYSNRKLSDEQVSYIISASKTKPELAKEFNVSWNTINRIVKKGGYKYSIINDT